MTTGAEAAWVWREFSTREALAAALAAEVAAALAYWLDHEIQTHGDDAEVTLAVSGGTTPKLFFNTLATEDIAWSKVNVTLCDERFVPPTSSRSNEALVRAELLRERAVEGRFIPLYREAGSVEDAAAAADEDALARFTFVAVLGMGLDGHTASLFPDAAEIAEALDPDSLREVIAIHAPSAGEPRLSMTLQALSTPNNVFLHIEGREKRAAFERAMQSEPPLPIRAVIEAARRRGGLPVQVFWAS